MNNTTILNRAFINIHIFSEDDDYLYTAAENKILCFSTYTASLLFSLQDSSSNSKIVHIAVLQIKSIPMLLSLSKNGQLFFWNLENKTIFQKHNLNLLIKNAFSPSLNKKLLFVNSIFLKNDKINEKNQKLINNQKSEKNFNKNGEFEIESKEEIKAEIMGENFENLNKDKNNDKNKNEIKTAKSVKNNAKISKNKLKFLKLDRNNTIFKISIANLIKNYTKNEQNLTKNDQNLTKNNQNLSKNDQNLTKNDQNLSKNDQNLTKNNQNLTKNDQNSSIKKIFSLAKCEIIKTDEKGRLLIALCRILNRIFLWKKGHPLMFIKTRNSPCSLSIAEKKLAVGFYNGPIQIYDISEFFSKENDPRQNFFNKLKTVRDLLDNSSSSDRYINFKKSLTSSSEGSYKSSNLSLLNNNSNESLTTENDLTNNLSLNGSLNEGLNEGLNDKQKTKSLKSLNRKLKRKNEQKSLENTKNTKNTKKLKIENDSTAKYLNKSFTKLHWHAHKVNALLFTGENYLLSGGEEGVLSTWRLENGQKDFLARLRAGIISISCSDDGVFYAIGTKNSGIIIVDSLSNKVISTINALHINKENENLHIKISPADNCLVINSIPGTLQFYDHLNQTKSRNLNIIEYNVIKNPKTRPIKLPKVSCFAFSDDCTAVAAVLLRNIRQIPKDSFEPFEQSIRIFSLNANLTGYELNTIVKLPHFKKILKIEFCPTRNDTFATATKKEIKIWALEQNKQFWQCVQNFNAKKDRFGNLPKFKNFAFWSDGIFLAVVFGTKIHILETIQFNEIYQINTDFGRIEKIKFFKNGLIFSQEKSIHFWNFSKNFISLSNDKINEKTQKIEKMEKFKEKVKKIDEKEEIFDFFVISFDEFDNFFVGVVFTNKNTKKTLLKIFKFNKKHSKSPKKAKINDKNGKILKKSAKNDQNGYFKEFMKFNIPNPAEIEFNRISVGKYRENDYYLVYIDEKFNAVKIDLIIRK